MTQESASDASTRVPSDEIAPSAEGGASPSIRTPLFQANNTARYQRQDDHQTDPSPNRA